MADSWYNGYSPRERSDKGHAGDLGRANGSVPSASGPCALCGDPDAAVEPHSEDYSLEYRWEPPALYSLCRHCHRNKLHKRFRDPLSWFIFKAHVRRGGYARDLKEPSIRRELPLFRRSVESGEPATLAPLRARRLTGDEWWERLSVDPLTLTSVSARPRR